MERSLSGLGKNFKIVKNQWEEYEFEEKTEDNISRDWK